MFVGQFEHQLDDKGRVVLPSTFRAQLADGGFIASDESGRRCLVVFQRNKFMEEAERLLQLVRDKEISRDAVTRFGGSASEMKPDGQGRVAIPPTLRDHAGLGDRGGVVVVGSLDRIEIWDAQIYRQTVAAAGGPAS